ncbi:MAG: hypothetical protein KC910_33905, partial [Candidatus Eremiobacteraeota bacterium]|nr:hypothetical protein [Candidatus Eremiobacteraeota bacterium]
MRAAKGQALVHGEPAKLDRAELFKLWLQPENRAERLAQAAELCPEMGSEAATLLGQKMGSRLSPQQRDTLRKLCGQFGNRRGVELFGFLADHQLDGQKRAIDTLAHVVAAGERGRWSASGNWGPDTEDGRLCWADSPGRDYRDNSDTSLEGPILDLTGAVGTRFKFDLKTATENGPDKLTIEARPPDGAWKELARFTGSSPWTEQDLDLSAFDGQKVQLRLRFASDRSVTGRGVFVAEPRLSAQLDGSPKTLWSGQAEGPDFSLRGLLESLPQGPEALTHLELLSQIEERVGNLAQAADLYKVLSPSLGQPDFSARREALLGLVQRFGRQQAVATWPVLDHPDVYTDPGANQAVTAILQSARQAGWSTEGTWGLETAAPFGQVWSDSPGGQYANSQNTSLTSREFSLVGLKHARLEFLESHQLESTIDKVHVEALGADGKWQTLKTLVGSQSWTRDQLDLSAFDGQTTKIRFRLETDRSVTCDGIKLAALTVRAEDAGGQQVVAFRGDPGEVKLDELLASISSG